MYLAENKESIINRGVLKIADMGCADGLNDARTLKAIIHEARKIIPNIPISIYMNDLP